MNHQNTKILRFFLLIVLGLNFVSFNELHAQKTKIYGSVSDAVSLEKLPFASVAFKGSSVGTVSDEQGNFILETSRKFDSLSVSSIGYKTETVAVSAGVIDEIDFKLIPTAIELGQVQILPGENPAFEILRKVIAGKKGNTPENAEAYEYEVYHKVQFDLNHFTEKIKKNFFVRPFDYIWENTNTTVDGVNYLPIILTESSEKHFYRKNPSAKKEFIQGRQTTKFFEAPKIMQFVGDMYIDPNIYQNYVTILDRPFPSPINDNYKRNYKFYLAQDSIFEVNGYPCHKINFRPKGKSDVAFTGVMYIHDSTYAVVEVDLEFSIEANINFVRNYWIRQDYKFIENQQWFLTKSHVIGDFTVVENSAELTGFFGRKTSEFRDIKLNQPRDDKFYSGIDRVIEEENAYGRPDSFWLRVRQDTLGLEEQNLISMAQRINEDKKWVWMVNSIKMLATSWLTWGKFDLGNIFTFYSHNKVEGSRVKFGIRTNEDFSRKVKLAGYGAYGIKDQKFKYGGEASLIFAKKQSRKMVLGAHYRKDLVQQGRSENMIPLDHVLTSLVRISGAEKRTLVEDYNTYLERQWFTGFSSRVSFFRQDIQPFGDHVFRKLESDGDTTFPGNFTTTGAQLNLRFAWGEKDLPATFAKKESGLFFAKYPVLSLQVKAGFKDLLQGDFDFQSIKGKLEHQLRLKKWGYLNMLIEGGVIYGTVPYPLLHVPDGNPLVLNDNRAFNLMNYLEFASDKYVSVQLEQHFDGLLFNKIPGIRKLKLRSFLLGKLYYGALRTENAGTEYLFTKGLSGMNTPYAEVGFGIENILKISRIDFTWRINYLNKPDVYRFIVKPSFYFRF